MSFMTAPQRLGSTFSIGGRLFASRPSDCKSTAMAVGMGDFSSMGADVVVPVVGTFRARSGPRLWEK